MYIWQFTCSYLKVVFKPSSFGIADTIVGFIPSAIFIIAKALDADYTLTVDWPWLVAVIFGGLIAVRVSIAPYMVYKDMRIKLEAENKKLAEELHISEWEHRRVELAKLRQPFLSQIVGILSKMKERVEFQTVQTYDTPTNKDMLDNLSNYLWGETELKLETEMEQKIFLIELSGAMNALGIGLNTVLSSDTEWQQLSAKLDSVVERVPDTDLKQHIKDYLIWLDGMGHNKLFSHYVDICEAERDLRARSKSFGGKLGLEHSVAQVLTKVAKRIEELRIGDEAK